MKNFNHKIYMEKKMELKPIDIDNESLEEREKRFIELDNNIIKPEYEKFLKDYNIYSLSDGSNNKTIKPMDLLKLHQEVMFIFLKIVPRIKLYNGHVYKYETLMNDHFTFSKYQTDNILIDYNKHIELNNIFKDQFARSVVIILIATFILSFFLINYFLTNIVFLREYQSFINAHRELFLYVEAGMSLLLCYLIYIYLYFPIDNYTQKNKNYVKRLKEIKVYLESGNK